MTGLTGGVRSLLTIIYRQFSYLPTRPTTVGRYDSEKNIDLSDDMRWAVHEEFFNENDGFGKISMSLSRKMCFRSETDIFEAWYQW